MNTPGADSSAGSTRPQTVSTLRTGWAILWRSVVFFVLWGGLTAPAMIIPGAWIKELRHQSPAQYRLYVAAATSAASLAAVGLMMRAFHRRDSFPLGFDRTNFGAGCLGGLAGGAVWLGLSVGLVALAGGVKVEPHGVFAWTDLAWGAVGLYLAALVEEVITRSYIFQLIRHRAGPVWAVLVTSVVFTALHAGAFHGAVLPMVNVFAASVLFSLVLLWTGRLWTVIAFHFSWNFLEGPVLGLAVSGQDLADGWRVLSLHGSDLLTGGRFGLEGSGVVTLVTTAACIGMAGLIRRAGWRLPQARGQGAAV